MDSRFWRGIFSLLLLVGSPLYAGDIVVNSFSGLDTQDNPAALQPSQSQDLLNVLLQPGGASVFKRDGYALFQTLTLSTEPVHGAYHFQQTGGSDVQLWGGGTKLNSIVSDGASVIIATGTEAATWQCTDNLGSAYCVDSSADMPIKTDGSANLPANYQPTIPLGTMVTSTPLQLVVAGVSGNLSTLYFSANNNFTNFTVGPLATDPYTEIINSPGSRITHIAYYFGKVFWWKDQSFGYLSQTSSQYTVGLTIISNQVGTLDNSSAFWNPTNYTGANNFSQPTQTTSSGNPYFSENPQLGGIFFRGQDSHIYQFDGYTLTRLSRIIAPTISQSSRRKSDSWTQTSQADFNNGGVFPPVQISTTVSPGDVTVSSFTVTENSNTQWSNGTTNNTTITGSGAGSFIALSTNNSGTATNPDFESSFSGNWTDSGGLTPITRVSSVVGTCTINPQTGSFFASDNHAVQPITIAELQLIDLSNNVLSSNGGNQDTACTWKQYTVTAGSNIGKRVKFRLHTQWGGSFDEYLTTSDSYILGGSITYYEASAFLTAGSVYYAAFDNIQNGSSTIATGSFTSQIYNTAITSSTFQISNFTWVGVSTPTFSIITSTANPSNNWVQLNTSSATNKQFGNQYVQFVSTLTVNGADPSVPSITNDSVLARSSGTYYSAVNNAPSASSWNTFSVNDFTNGASTITYYVRASSNPFSVQSSTPAWTVQQKNSLVNLTFPALTIATTYFQMRADFAITAATETPIMNDFTFNWYEGSASDKAYINYFQDAIWFSVSAGTTTTNNDQILYLDLLNNAWMKFDIAANGFLVENNVLYFGDPTNGRVFKYGGVTTDNGANIRSYWKSKDFTGSDPTVQNEFLQSDFMFGTALSTVTYTYNLDQGKTATSVLVPTFDSAASIVKRGFLLAQGKIGTFYNFMVGDNSSFAKWTLMLHRVHYNSLNWRPQTN